MKTLFSDKETTEYFHEISDKIEKEISGFTDEKIMTIDFEEWANFLFSKYEIMPIVLFEDNISCSVSETKMKQHNHWHLHDSYEPEYYTVDAYEVIYSIPFDGNDALLYLTPARLIMTSKFEASVQAPRGNSVGTISLSFTFPVSILKSQPNIEEFMQNSFNSEFKRYKDKIHNVNVEVEQFNSSLKGHILSQLEIRKNKARDYFAIRDALKIPMQLNPNAPNIAPIPLKRVTRKVQEQPAMKASPQEYGISEDDYQNIIRIINNCASSMEKTAQTHAKLHEEEIRDVILATLNTHYDNKATGETFRKVGKTDIQIPFENKAAYIAECKIWHGIKQFEEAIQQLFSYSTWRDTKLSLIIFNKSNKHFFAIIKALEAYVREKRFQNTKLFDNVWQCTINESKSNRVISLSIAAYDLCVN